MIDSAQLLDDLKTLLILAEKDLHHQVRDRPEVRRSLQADYDAARRVGRTQDTFETWSEEPVTQAAVAWLLGTVFVRFLEDNELVEPMLSGGQNERHRRALQEHQHYFQQHPTHSEREYLEYMFERLAAIPATAALFDRRHNPLWRLPLSADAARELVEFLQRIDPESGQVAHDFADESLETRFLGDLYQDLSEPVRKRYALLQTPRFVEAFILDRTLTPAIETFGYRQVRLIDPTCGSGHFLLGAFDRMLALAQEHEPGKDVRVLVQNVLSRVVGVDINPYAVAIAHFRLTVAAVKACGITRLSEVPGFDVSVVAADSLLHGPRFADDGSIQMSMLPDDPTNQYYFAEDENRVRALLRKQYHVVVGNPPYITVKDPALRDLYRTRYGSCKGKYSLVVPFMERFFELALRPETNDSARAGFVGLIVSNSFMKREFGDRLIEQYIPRWDLTHVVDTSLAYIDPEHGTPTAILIGRHRPPSTEVVRAVMGVRGEQTTPEDPARSPVWTAILSQIDTPGSQSIYIDVADVERASFHRHPWNIAGGGARELKKLLDERGVKKLETIVEAIGITSVTGEDDLYLLDSQNTAHRLRIDQVRTVVKGDSIRDWTLGDNDVGIWLYDDALKLTPLDQLKSTARLLWTARTTISRRKRFGVPMLVRGLTWYEWQELYPEKLLTPLSIAFAFVATHNHFVLDRGGKVFKQSVGVIKLRADAGDAHHLRLLGLLNSSLACFWMKQVSYPKSSAAGDISLEKGRPEANRYDFSATALASFPVPAGLTEDCYQVLEKITRKLVALAARSQVLEEEPIAVINVGTEAIVSALQRSSSEHTLVTGQMVALQEELDWEVYRLFGLTSGGADLTCVTEPSVSNPEWRPFCWDSSEVPQGALVPPLYKARRREILDVRFISLLETVVNKRPWLGRQGVYGHASKTFEERCLARLHDWLLQRLESEPYWRHVELRGTSKLSDVAARDEEFMRVAEAYTGDPAFGVVALVQALVLESAIPFLPVLRYADSGLRKRDQWERTWDLQRQEDTGTRVGEIPVPPKYTSDDFKNGGFWRLRGKLDVPKERFISYPGCERAADGSLPIAWAGWDHAQQARALGAYYMQIKTEEGTVPQKLVPLLAGLLELLPWIRQWHSGPDPEFGVDLGDEYANFVDAEARALGLTIEQVRAWRPEARPRAPRRRRRG